MSATLPAPTRFSALARLLHWLMAAMIGAMLFIGIGMVATVGPAYLGLLDLHRPLGIAILLLAVVRVANRLIVPPPPLPDTLSPAEKRGAHASHLLLYALMIAMPLVGWGMVSAADVPVVMWQGVTLPHILPPSPRLFACLRETHTVLAFVLLLTVLAHLAAALLHALILRDGVFASMASLRPAVDPERRG